MLAGSRPRPRSCRAIVPAVSIYLRSLSGLENLSGIPASVGGGVFNNLGAFGTSLSEFIDYVKVIDINNPDKVFKLDKKDCNFDYRHSIFQNSDLVVLRVKFVLKKDEKTLIQKRIVSTIDKKVLTQPLNHAGTGHQFHRRQFSSDQCGISHVR